MNTENRELCLGCELEMFCHENYFSEECNKNLAELNFSEADEWAEMHGGME